jgi:deoxyinosine 3'endonuclease (endonuclease V)
VALDVWPPVDEVRRLEEKISKEVESKQIIEEPFHFPTATDISYEDRSDNPSFLPIYKHNQKENISYI